jgi:hypothetical protein
LTSSDRCTIPLHVGVGVDIATFGSATIDNTNIVANLATTNDNDVDGTVSM